MAHLVFVGIKCADFSPSDSGAAAEATDGGSLCSLTFKVLGAEELTHCMTVIQFVCDK